MDIILYLIQLVQQLYQQNCWLIQFICKYIPLRQWAFDDSHSPKYQKFKVDEIPKIIYHRQDWDWKGLNAYYTWKYGKPVQPVRRRSASDIPQDCTCPACKAPSIFLYRNNGKKGQLLCKVCQTRFSPDENRFSKKLSLKFPYCSHTLSPKKDRKHFIVHKCINPKCPYYLHNLKKVDKEDLAEDYGKNKYKLHYIYREFTIDFFKFDITTLPKNASSLRFSKNNAYIMSLCLTMHVNLGLSNDDAVSKEFRPYKQLIERLNRTYKASYRPTNGFDGYDGANYDLALWVAYYNFLRPHKSRHYKPPVEDPTIQNGENMPGKWQLLIYLGQQTILNLQNQTTE